LSQRYRKKTPEALLVTVLPHLVIAGGGGTLRDAGVIASFDTAVMPVESGTAGAAIRKA
jgi:hypothetical protein